MKIDIAMFPTVCAGTRSTRSDDRGPWLGVAVVAEHLHLPVGIDRAEGVTAGRGMRRRSTRSWR